MGWWRNQYEDTPAAKQKRQYNPAFLSWFLAETLGTVTCCCFAPANPNQRGDSTARDPKAPLNSNLSHWVVSLIALLWMPLLLSDCKSPCYLGYHVKHFWWWCRAPALKYYSREEAQASKITPVTDSAHRDKERGDRMRGGSLGRRDSRGWDAWCFPWTQPLRGNVWKGRKSPVPSLLRRRSLGPSLVLPP